MSIISDLRIAVSLRRIARSLERIEKHFLDQSKPQPRKVPKLAHIDTFDVKEANERHERELQGWEQDG